VIKIVTIGISLLPVCVFLVTLIFIDSYRLVSAGAVIKAILIGAGVALLSLFVNLWLIDIIALSRAEYTRYLAPVLEESFKAVYLIILFRIKRIGFMVDGAIYGFAIGTGFALVENIYYLIGLNSSNLLLWIVRGFGTAAIHGAVVAILAIISKSLIDRSGKESLQIYFPGFLLAVAIHSFYNHFIFSPLLSTLIVVVILPLLLVAVFNRSENLTRTWLGIGFDADQELLYILSSGEISKTKIGKYLESLQGHFPAKVVADMLCLIRIHTELALKAKGMLMMRQTGIPVPADPEVNLKLNEMRYLEKSIGKTGKLAIHPFLYKSSRDFWQITRIK